MNHVVEEFIEMVRAQENLKRELNTKQMALMSYCARNVGSGERELDQFVKLEINWKALTRLTDIRRWNDPHVRHHE